MNVTEQHKAAARNAIRRGAKPGEPIPRCRCFQDGAAAILSRPNCNGVCEDAVDHVARTIVDALSAERARVIEECARVAETFHEDDDGIDRQVKRHVAAALRALGQQDTGGADHG